MSSQSEEVYIIFNYSGPCNRLTQRVYYRHKTYKELFCIDRSKYDNNLINSIIRKFNKIKEENIEEDEEEEEDNFENIKQKNCLILIYNCHWTDLLDIDLYSLINCNSSFIVIYYDSETYSEKRKMKDLGKIDQEIEISKKEMDNLIKKSIRLEKEIEDKIREKKNKITPSESTETPKTEDIQEIKKSNIIFETPNGKRETFSFDYGTTVEEALNSFMKEMNKFSEVKNEEIVFLHDGKELNLLDQTKVEALLKSSNNSIINVTETGILDYNKKEYFEKPVYQSVTKDITKENQDIKKLNIIFETTALERTSFAFNYGTSVGQVLYWYITQMNKIREALENQIIFLFNAKRLFFGDQTKIEVFFKYFLYNPVIVVIETKILDERKNNYLGTKKEKKEVTDISIKDKPKDFQDIKKLNIIFKTNTGKENTFVFNYGSTVDKVLSFYITKMNKITEALENQIIFLFNGNILFFGDQTKIEVFFKYYLDNPVITVFETTISDERKI